MCNPAPAYCVDGTCGFTAVEHINCKCKPGLIGEICDEEVISTTKGRTEQTTTPKATTEEATTTKTNEKATPKKETTTAEK